MNKIINLQTGEVELVEPTQQQLDEWATNRAEQAEREAVEAAKKSEEDEARAVVEVVREKLSRGEATAEDKDAALLAALRLLA